MMHGSLNEIGQISVLVYVIYALEITPTILNKKPVNSKLSEIMQVKELRLLQ